MSSQPQAMNPWEGGAGSPSCPYGAWQKHKDAPALAQGGGEKRASCPLRSELHRGGVPRAFPCPIPPLRDLGFMGDQPEPLSLWPAIELQAQPRRTAGIMLRATVTALCPQHDPPWVTAGP